MNKSPKIVLLVTLILFIGIPLYAADFGLILDQTAAYDSDGGFTYSGTLIPRFSTRLGDSAELYLSASLYFQADDPPILVPELLRTEISWDFGMGDLTAGRMYYSDPLGIIADGLFDGAKVSLDTNAGSFSLGAWYTGLLYKKRANIIMNNDEAQAVAAELDPTNFSTYFDSYFATRRAFAALEWEHPGLGERVKSRVSYIGQFDLSGSDLHTQYLAAKFTVPGQIMVFDIGGGVELLHFDNDINIALTGEMGFSWMFSGSVSQQLSLLGRFSSGVFEDTVVSAFRPLTIVSQGSLLQAPVSGLSTIALDHTARFTPSFSTNLSSTYFIRSDLGSYNGYPVTVGDADRYFLGNEFFGRLFWGPISDLQITLGGGVFLPFLGDVAPKADMLWRVELNVILSLY